MTKAASGIEERFGAFDYEHATAGDAMRQEVIYCPPEAPLRTVARIMARTGSTASSSGPSRGGASSAIATCFARPRAASTE